MNRLLLLATAVAMVAGAQPYDVLIRNARVVDGTGNPWFRSDIGIRGGRIAAIGKLEQASAAKVIDAADRVAAPGFIDVHTHIEQFIEQVPRADSFLMDGVTTVVTGNCGKSASDLRAFFAKLEEARTGINVAALIGHNSVRMEAMGFANRAPAAAEMARMKELVIQGMRDGAAGFSSGLWYVPGVYSQTDEVIELAKAAAPFGGVYATHMRDEGAHVEEAIREALAVGRASGLRVQISHFKVLDRRHWGSTAKTLAMIDEARRGGLDVVVDQYPYTAASTRIEVFFPRSVLADGPAAIVERLTSPESRKRVAAEIAADPELRMGQPDYSFAIISDSPEDRSLEGKTVAQINRERGRKPTLADEIETVIDLRIKGNAVMVYHVMEDSDVERVLRYPWTAIASDAIFVPFGETLPHPRNYGTNARVLAEYVRKRKAITLEDAVRKMTSLPARTFGFADRGLIREGMAADVVVFDPARVQDMAVFDKPHQYSRGFDWVLVNGTPVVEEGVANQARPGQVLRRR